MANSNEQPDRISQLLAEVDKLVARLDDLYRRFERLEDGLSEVGAEAKLAVRKVHDLDHELHYRGENRRVEIGTRW